MIASRFWPFATIAFGLAILALLIAFGQLPEVRTAFPKGDFAEAMRAFQLARSLSDLVAVFGAPVDPRILAAMDAANRLDLYAFMPAYAVFLICASAMVAGGFMRAFSLGPIFLIGVALYGDVLETTTQLRITSAGVDAAAPLLRNLMHGAMLKNLGLAAHAASMVSISLILSAIEKRAANWWIVALGSVACCVAIAGLFLREPFTAAIAPALAAFWLALFMIALTRLRHARVIEC